MRALPVVLMLGVAVFGVRAQEHKGPANPKAQKTFHEAEDWLQHDMYASAIGSFRKADKQDGGHCEDCAYQIIQYGLKIGDYKDADEAAEQLVADARDRQQSAQAHWLKATVELREAIAENKAKTLQPADQNFKAVIAAYPQMAEPYYYDGVVLARLSEDDAAKAQLGKFMTLADKKNVLRLRAERYLENLDLARARMAPGFAIRTLDQREVSLDGLTGKVVLIDFWATWCGPCREALPHIRQIAQRFQGEPLIVLSVSLDKDDGRWKEFVAKNKMTWLQYRDDSGDLARAFKVEEIPHTFTIDADGVLQDEHVGDANIEGKLKKLCARAKALEEAPKLAMQNPTGD